MSVLPEGLQEVIVTYEKQVQIGCAEAEKKKRAEIDAQMQRWQHMLLAAKCGLPEFVHGYLVFLFDTSDGETGAFSDGHTVTFFASIVELENLIQLELDVNELAEREEVPEKIFSVLRISNFSVASDAKISEWVAFLIAVEGEIERAKLEQNRRKWQQEISEALEFMSTAIRVQSNVVHGRVPNAVASVRSLGEGALADALEAAYEKAVEECSFTF